MTALHVWPKDSIRTGTYRLVDAPHNLRIHPERSARGTQRRATRCVGSVPRVRCPRCKPGNRRSQRVVGDTMRCSNMSRLVAPRQSKTQHTSDPRGWQPQVGRALLYRPEAARLGDLMVAGRLADGGSTSAVIYEGPPDMRQLRLRCLGTSLDLPTTPPKLHSPTSWREICEHQILHLAKMLFGL